MCGSDDVALLVYETADPMKYRQTVSDERADREHVHSAGPVGSCPQRHEEREEGLEFGGSQDFPPVSSSEEALVGRRNPGGWLFRKRSRKTW